MSGVRDYSIAELKHNVVGLAKAAKALKLPIVVTTTARDSMWGPTFPELIEALPGVQIIDRSSVNAFDDPLVAHAIEATGRKKLIFAGLALEVCAAFPAITAVSKGLDAYVAVDVCGTFSETKHQVGLLRMMQAGVILSDYKTLMIEVLKDNTCPEVGAVYGAIDMDWAKLVGQIAQAHGKQACCGDARPAGGSVANRRSVAKRNRVLVSREALRLAMGISHRLARLGAICRLCFAACRWRLFVSAEKGACRISDLCSRRVGRARRRLLAQRRTAAVALGVGSKAIFAAPS